MRRGFRLIGSAIGRRRRLFVVVLAAFFFYPVVAPPVGARTQPGSPAPVVPGGPLATPNEVPAVIEQPPAPIAALESGGGLVANSGVTPRVELPPHVAPQAQAEVASLRTEFSRVLENPDGSFRSENFSHRVNFRDAAGTWQPIDTSLVPSTAPGYQLRTTANDIPLRLSTVNGDRRLAEFEAMGTTLRLRAPGASAGVLAANRTGLTFPRAVDSSTLAVTPVPEGLNFRVTLPSRSAPAVYHFVLDTGGLAASLASDHQTIVLSNDDRQAVVTISPPRVFDANHAFAPPESTITTLTTRGPLGTPLDLVQELAPDEVLIGYSIDRQWLRDSERAFPVVLDPTACVQPGLVYTAACTFIGSDDNYVETFVLSASPDAHQTGWTVMRIGYGSDGYGKMRGLFFFPSVSLPDGAQVVDSTFRLHQLTGYSGRQLQSIRIASGWSNQSTWNTQPGYEGSYTAAVSSLGAAGYLDQDVTAMVRSWYTRRWADWQPNVGIMTRLVDELDAEVRFNNASDPDATLRPRLIIDYVVPRVKVSFAPELGEDFVPSSMVAGQPIGIPVRLTNNGSGFTFPATADSDYYRLGARWIDMKGNVFSPPAFASLPTTLNSGTTTATFPITITPPTTPGHYTLRLDLVHTVNSTNLFASDWAQQSKYLARNKRPNTTPSDTRWLGSSVIERSEFPITVVTGGGTNGGATATTGLPDGSQIGIDLRSQNLHLDGAGGVAFDDLLQVGLAYQYDSRHRLLCGGILEACGWSTNFDERFERSATAGNYTYQDPQGNRYPVATDGQGQLRSAAPALLERPRHTIFEENGLAASFGSVTYSTTTAYSGSRSLRIAQPNIFESSDFAPVSISDYPLVSFAASASGDKAAIAFRIHDNRNDTDTWLFYTLGSTSWTVSGFASIYIGGSITSWRQVLHRNIYNDARNTLSGESNDLSVNMVGIRGPGGTNSTSYIYYDAIRFEARSSGYFWNGVPSGMTGSVSTHTADKALGTASIRVTSPASAGTSGAGTVTGLNSSVTLYPYLTWHWKKVGGQTVAVEFTLKNERTGATGTLCYVAGPATTGLCSDATRIRIADTAPDQWTRVTRNLLEDARQVLGFYNDSDTSGTSNTPGGGPVPDGVLSLGYRLIPYDGSYGLFDEQYLSTVPNGAGEQLGDVVGDDFLVTLAGGVEHRFNRDGLLIGVEDADNNSVDLVWSHDYGTRKYELTHIQAPGHGDPLSTGAAATRQIVVSRPTDLRIRFAENIDSGLGARYTEFTRNANDDLMSVVPARRSASCAATRPSGCLEFDYTASNGHYLWHVYDPRYDGANNFISRVGWSGASPTAIVDHANGQFQRLRVLSWDAGSSTYVRPVWQDAQGYRTNTATYVDLSPNGEPLYEYVPKPCGAASCTALPPAPAFSDRAVAYESDGLSRISTVTRYRNPGESPIVTRRATQAAAKIDNYADPLTANEVIWSQTSNQYQSSGANGSTTYVTRYDYNNLHLVTRTRTPFTNPSGGAMPVQEISTLYDAEGHPTQVSDNSFLENPGFEAGLSGWTLESGTGGTWEQSNVYSGAGSLEIAGTAVYRQIAQLLPGQTFRFQVRHRAVSGSARYRIEYWNTSTAAWTTILGPVVNGSTTWATGSYDVTMPVENSDGRIRVGMAVNGGSGTVYFDDFAVFTTFAAASYLPNGLNATEVDVLGHIADYDYLASSKHPAIFATAVTQNFVANGPSGSDQNVFSTATYDAVGRVLTTSDPDGVTLTSTYAANRTDIASEIDGLGNTSVYTYDAVGNVLTSTTPLGETTSTTFGFLGNPLEITAPDGTRTRHEYDASGLRTSTIAHYVDGSPSGPSGVDDVRTSFGYDTFGRLTETVADAGAGLIGATTRVAFDLLGNEVTREVFPNSAATGTPRTVTQYFHSAGNLGGTRGPVTPTSAPAPACPNGGGVLCNETLSVDLNARVVSQTNVYGKVTRTWYDFAGLPVVQVANHVDGVFVSTAADTDLRTTTRYDAAGRVVALTDPLGRTTSTTYDALDRVTRITRPDSSWIRTDYTAAGRTELMSQPGAATATEADVSWTRNVYDAAGRQTATIANFDRSGSAQLQITGFESISSEGFTSSANAILSAGASATASGPANTGRAALRITTTASPNQGVSLELTGTFIAGRTYAAAVWVKGDTSGQSYGLALGYPSVGAFAEATATSTGEWQRLVVSWTPSAAYEAGVVVALRANRGQAAANAVRMDDVSVWDTGTPDRNIPTETVQDGNGRVTASLLPPAEAGGVRPVTATEYDEMGRVTSISINHVAGGSTTAPDTNLSSSFAYDALGRQTSGVDAAGITTRYTYDRLARLLSTTLNHQNGAFDPSVPDEDVASTYAYNSIGELVGVCAPQRVIADSCDPSSSADPSAWHYAYDSWGNRVAQVPPVNTSLTHLAVTASSYDAGNRLTRRCSYPDTASSCASATRYTDFTYDGVGQLTATNVYVGAPGAATLKLTSTYGYDAGGQRTRVSFDGTPSAQGSDTLTAAYDSLGRVTGMSRGATQLTGYVWNADGTVSTRTDPAGTSTFVYDWGGRLTSATSPLFTGAAGFSWQLDGLLAGRTWPGGMNAATVTYDAAKRPTAFTERYNGVDQAVLGQTYDRVGNVTSESRTFAGVASLPGLPALAGSGTQEFSYDRLRRVTSATLGSTSVTYAYDASGNRTRVIENSVTTNYAFDRADQLISQHAGSDPVEYFAYDSAGNLTGSAVAVDGLTGYTYDAADRLLSIDAPGADNTITFTFDALGRHRTRSVSGTLSDTYHYEGASETVIRIEQPTVTLDSAVTSNGDRIANRTSAGSFGWTLPDLHGNTAGALSSNGASVSDAFRYDPYGELITSETSSLPTPWRYQGRMLISSPGETDLYDAGARFYDPGLGTFTQLDSVAGSAQNPLSLNRYLYAWANPASMIDPDGHAARLGNPQPKGGKRPPAPPPPPGKQLQQPPPAAPKSQPPAKTQPAASSGTAKQPVSTVGSKGPAPSAAKVIPRSVCSAAELNCTMSILARMSFDQRLTLQVDFQALYRTDGYFNVFESVLAAARDVGLNEKSWLSLVDARVLVNMQNGWRLYRGFDVRDPTAGAEGFERFFAAQQDPGERRSRDLLVALHSAAEDLSVRQGVSEAAAFGRVASFGERAVLLAADTWRIGASNREFVRDASSGACNGFTPCVAGSFMIGENIGAGIADWSFDQRNRDLAYWSVIAAYHGGEAQDVFWQPIGSLWTR